MNIEVLADADAVARAGAAFVAGEARAAVAARGRFTVAFSGGRTPWVMLRALAGLADVPWASVHVAQVDERIAPAGDADRNLTHLAESLLDRAPLAPERMHAMPVEFPDPALGGRALRRDAPRHRRCAAGAGPRPPRVGYRRAHRIACAGRPGARGHRRGRRGDRRVPGPAPHDPDLSGDRSRPADPVAGDRRREGGRCSRVCEGAIPASRPDACARRTRWCSRTAPRRGRRWTGSPPPRSRTAGAFRSGRRRGRGGVELQRVRQARHGARAPPLRPRGRRAAGARDRARPARAAYVPLLARVRPGRRAGPALRVPRARSVRAGQGAALRRRQGAARSVREGRRAAGRLEPRGGVPPRRQRGHRAEERRRRSRRVRLGGRRGAAPAVREDGRLRAARRAGSRATPARGSRRRGAGRTPGSSRRSRISRTWASPRSSCCRCSRSTSRPRRRAA